MRTFVWAVGAGVAVAFVATAAVAAPKGAQGSATGAVKRGEYVVTISGCNDCHTPWKMGANGPEQDRTRLLSGHPQDLAMPPAPEVIPPWVGSMSGTFTAWAGPWGVSFAANLTPDPETGLGKWTVDSFIEAMRTGRHQGRGRPILPPMPWENVSKMTDADLKAAFAYLRSIPAIENRVPDPIPPAGGASAAGAGSGGATETGTGSSGAPPAAR
jgi:hypothetical protein